MFTPIFCLSKTCILLKVRVTKLNPPNVEQTIDGETGWRMVVPTTLQCFLCGGQVIYKNKDTTRSRTTSPSPSSTWPLVVTNGHYGIWQFQLSIPLQIFIFKTSPNFHYQDISLPGFTTTWPTSTAWYSRWTSSWPLVGLLSLYLCLAL